MYYSGEITLPGIDLIKRNSSFWERSTNITTKSKNFKFLYVYYLQQTDNQSLQKYQHDLFFENACKIRSDKFVFKSREVSHSG